MHRPLDLRVLVRLVAVAALLVSPLGERLASARPFGEDALASPASKVSEADEAYRAIGRIECRLPDGATRISNAFLVGGVRLMAAGAEILGERAGLAKDSPCTARFYNVDGLAKDAVAAVRLVAPARARGETATDMALFRLARASPYARQVASHVQGRSAKLDGKLVAMVTLTAQRGGSLHKAKTRGLAFRLSREVAAARGVLAQAVMAVGYDSVSASRGSPVFDDAGRVVGAHRGSYCPIAGSFDRDRCFNELSLICDREHRWIAEEARSLSAPSGRQKP